MARDALALVRQIVQAEKEGGEHVGTYTADYFDTSAIWKRARMAAQPRLGLWTQRQPWRHLAHYRNSHPFKTTVSPGYDGGMPPVTGTRQCDLHFPI